MRQRIVWICALSLCVTLTTACLYKPEIRKANKATETENWDEAFTLWEKILEQDPASTKAKLEMERARIQAALSHLRRAVHYFERNKLGEAKFENNLVLTYDPNNGEARFLAKRITEREAALEKSIEEAEAEAETIGSGNLPQLQPKTWGALDLIFTKPTSVRDIYQALGRGYDVNIVIDTKIRDDKITLDLRNLDFLKALDTLMVLNRHFFKVIDDNTIVILEDNKNNRDRYDNQIIRTFYLSNIEPNDLKQHLQRLGGIKEYAENEALNAITIKGTEEQIALAEKIITANDKAKPEVIIEVELLEVSKSRSHKLGILPINPDLSSPTPLYRAAVAADPVNRSDDDSDVNGLRGVFPSLGSNDYLTIVPAIAIDFLKEHGDTTQVSNPQLRVTSGEKANIKIGQSIPIASTSFTSAQLAGSQGFSNVGDQALTSFNYNDVGISIEIEPRVHFNQEVTLALTLEITSVLSAGLQPILGKRQVSTSIRLRNGETNVLAGLLTNDERKSLSGIPGLSDIPILGRLFSNDEKTVSKTDIIMTIRPVVIRGSDINETDRAPYEVSSLRLSSLYAKAKREADTKDAEEADQPLIPRTSPENAEAEEDNADEHGSRGKPAFDPFAESEEREITQGEEATEGTDAEIDPEEPEPTPAMMSFMPPNLEARQDDTVQVQLFITNVENLRSGEIVVTYDPEVLQAESVQIGQFFDARGQRPLLRPAWNNARGRLSMVLSQRESGQPFSGSGILAEMSFRAKAPGNGNLEFVKVSLVDPEGNPLPAEGLNASFEVSP
ncbi:Cohesin domain-containing protein [Sulfidibacter corallicola]|uniref:Cohesin domain-containing protein n=1 Tax=Sulfidibacter corallicola TaxID=2818388 RepID=A0A8A4TW08_SULCO|nr:cohesin domain-containing protein [Sulfidibacter corallicola]QTD54146.1 hypothetical protein J3U87_17000 [Sulfidibacter corallicola]